MKRLKNECKNQMRRHRKGTSRFLALFLALAMIVSLGVDLSTTSLVHATERQGEPAYTCGKTEHVHSIENGCYALVCDKETGDHTHTLDCYKGVDPTCGIEESDPVEPHTHDDSCYEDVLICENTDDDHEHDEDCYERKLICGKEETEGSKGHEHTLDCYENATPNCEEDENHEHSIENGCYELTCTQDEHEHTDACVASNNNDRKSDSEWAEDAEDALTAEDGTDETDYQNWLTNTVAVAKSQLGYTEDEDGNTLYGNWYNEDGESLDWNSLFVSYVLDKAGVGLPNLQDDGSYEFEDIPSNDDFAQWASDLYDDGIYITAEDVNDEAESYYDNDPETRFMIYQGEVAFLDLDGDGDADHAGIVTSVSTEDQDNDDYAETITSVTVVLGDYLADDADDDAVASVTTLTLGDDDDDAATVEDALLGSIPVRSVMAQINPQSDDETTTGVDMGHYITSVVFQKKNNIIWEVATEFNLSDQVRGTINFENIATSTLQANSNTIYIDLPTGIDCSKFTGTYDTYDNGIHSGKYHYEKQSDGSYRMVLVLDDDYVEKAGDVIGGSLQFSFEWEKASDTSTGKTPIKIGDWSGEVKIIDDGSSKKEETSGKYSIGKSADGISYSEDGKTVYITYTVTLTLNQDMTSNSVTMKDVLSGQGFTYDTSYGIKVTGGDGTNPSSANYSDLSAQGTSTNIQLWGSGNLKKGTYTLTYRVKSDATVDVSDPATIPQSVNNKIQVPDKGDDTVSSETWTKTTTGTINKQGQLVSGSDATYIDYTVYLNAGDIVKNLKTAATFTDTLPSTVTLQGNVKVEQYDVSGNLKNTFTATADGQNISYTTPTGQYYYIITYRVKVNDSGSIPIGGLEIKNDGKSSGGIDGSSSSKVVVPNHVLHKNFSSQTVSKDDDGNWIDTMTWTSTIDVSESLKGYVYEDWAGLKYGYLKNTDGSLSDTLTGWYNCVSMSDAQRAAIVVKDGNGNAVDSSKYMITTSDHVDETLKDNDGNQIKNGLFKITFTDDVQGPVTLEYETTADLSWFVVGDQLSFINYASLTKDGHTDTDQAQTDTKQYEHDNKALIYKYGKVQPSDNANSGSYTLSPGETSIPWTITLNNSRKLYCDLTVEDTFDANLTYIPESLLIKVYDDDITTRATVTYNEITRKLSIVIPQNLYSSTNPLNKYSNVITITYRTELPKDFFNGIETDKTFSNTATVTAEGTVGESTFDEDVKRQVVGKSGSYDATNGVLTYNVVINPDASTLNDGKTLKAVDVLTTQDPNKTGFLKYVTLDSLQLFTANKSTNSSGDVTVEAGKYLRDLTLADSGTAEFTYTYDDETKTFTTYLPDSTAYVIVAKYNVSEDPSGDTALKNTVTLTGSKDWSKEDTGTTIKSQTSGETHTSYDSITIIKRDASNYSTVIPGATFKLEKYSNATWTMVGSQKTSADGTGEIAWGSSTSSTSKETDGEIEYNTLYRLTEVSAPAGYVKDDTPTYLVIVREGSETSIADTLPDTISGDSDYSKDKVKIYKVKQNDDTISKKYYANVTIDRYNAQDETRTEPGQLRVTKEWKDYNGNTMTAKESEVKVTLTQHVPKSNLTATFVAPDGHSWNKSFYKGATLTLYVNPRGGNGISGSTDEEMFQSLKDNTTIKNAAGEDMNVQWGAYTWIEGNTRWLVTLGPIDESCTITNNRLAWDDDGTQFSYTGGTAAEGTTDTVIGTVSLNSANGWTYLWSNLDRTTEGVYYTLVEQTVSGYTTTYTVNGTELAADKTPSFTPGASGDKITITNQEQTTSLKVHKNWMDGNSSSRPSTITVQLMRAIQTSSEDPVYEAVDGKTLEVKASDDWVATFNGLPISDENGNKYLYKVKELTELNGYTVEVGDLTADPENADQPYIEVTNTKQYDLPKTGGSGTLPWQAAGAVLLMISMFYGVSMRRGHERREG